MAKTIKFKQQYLQLSVAIRSQEMVDGGLLTAAAAGSCYSLDSRELIVNQSQRRTAFMPTTITYQSKPLNRGRNLTQPLHSIAGTNQASLNFINLSNEQKIRGSK